MASTTKTATLKGTNVDGDTVELRIPMAQKKVTASNNITNFSRPVNNPQNSSPSRETRALNMNRIQLNIQLSKFKVSDEFADKNHAGSGDRPNLSNKEDWIQEAWKLFIGGDIIDLKVTNNDTYSDTSEFSGYIHNLDWQEKASNEGSVYTCTLKLVDEIQMNS